MDPAQAILLLFGVFALVTVLGVPIAFSFLLASIPVIILDPFLNLSIIAIRMYAGVDNFILLAIPLFMYCAFLMNDVRITDDIVEVSRVLVGHIKGGLAHINVVASMFFAGVSGSSTADVAGIGAILIPAMTKQNYNKGFSASITAASSTIGNIIPPSLFMVLYGAIAGVSVGGLFIAGFIPGILVGVSQMLVAYLYVSKYGPMGKHKRSDVKEILSILIRKGFFPFTVSLLILGGIMGGLFTPTEAASLAAVYVIMLGFFAYRKLKVPQLLRNAYETCIMTANVMFIVATATLFAWLLSYYNALEYSFKLFSICPTPESFLLMVIIIFVLLGTFMAPVPAMIILVPLMQPVGEQVGVHPLLLGLIVVMGLCVGKITPPFAPSLLVANAIAKIPLSASLKSTLIFFAMFCTIMLVITFFPGLALFLPRIAMPQLFG